MTPRPTASARRPAAALLLLAPVALLLPAGCRREAAAAAGPPPPVPVVAAKAEARDVPVVVTAVGNVEPYQSVTVKTMIGGELSRVHFAEGDAVRRGGTIFTIDPRPYEAELRRAEAQLARDRAQLENARAEERRYSELVARDYVTREQYDRAVTQVAALEATVKADEAQVQQQQVELSYTTIRSPLDGRTGRLLVHEGNVVKANDTTLVTINQLRPIKVAFAVPQDRFPEIRARHAAGALVVEARPEGSGAGASGRLEFVDNAVDRQTGTILLKAVFPNDDDALWPGQFVTVRLVLATRPGATVVPTEAIQTGQKGPFVFAVTSGRTVEMRGVRPGLADGPFTVVEEGLAPGDEVVTDGHLRLFPGARVEVKSAGARP